MLLSPSSGPLFVVRQQQFSLNLQAKHLAPFPKLQKCSVCWCSTWETKVCHTFSFLYIVNKSPAPPYTLARSLHSSIIYYLLSFPLVVAHTLAIFHFGWKNFACCCLLRMLFFCNNSPSGEKHLLPHHPRRFQFHHPLTLSFQLSWYSFLNKPDMHRSHRSLFFVGKL